MKLSMLSPSFSSPTPTEDLPPLIVKKMDYLIRALQGKAGLKAVHADVMSPLCSQLAWSDAWAEPRIDVATQDTRRQVVE